MSDSIKFDIEKKNEVDKTFRVKKIMSMFDLKPEHSNEHFVGEIVLPDEWHIGAIIGNSGTGKSTIGKEIYGDKIEDNFEYTHKSVLDDMPENCSLDEISKMFYAVGFGSTPSWLKPYKVLSNGEKMRVDLARKLLQDDFIVFDEFTSVVDRNVAQTMCIAANKAIKKTGKKMVVIGCHSDILEWLEPDWYFDTNQMKSFFGQRHDEKKYSRLENATSPSGENLGSIII